MNKTYRLIWNDLTQSWIAVSELAKSRGKRSSKALLLSAALSAVLPAPAFAQTPPATALPTGGRVVAGTASIAQNAAVMNINQATPRAALDWSTFNVGSSATVNFNQPSASAVTLNRVLDPNPSQIFGRINANGQVFLSNPNGVVFGPGASLDVGGLVATTHRIGLDDFMAGKTTFSRDGASGAVINQGELKAKLGGYIALLAPEVRNQGVIVANMGTVALAAGETFELQFVGNNTLAGLRVTPATINTLVENGRAVLAPGGLVILSSQAVDRIQSGIIKNSGEIEASSLVERGGKVMLLGDNITLAAGSSIKASGATGGGTVLVGGDWQGSNGVHQASTVTVDAKATIDASATKSGDGGKVVLWSTGSTDFAGRIDAQGKGTGHRGGDAEVSGKKLLNYSGFANLLGGAPGLAGNLLLDPYNIYVISGSTGSLTATADNSILGVDTLTTALAGANVTVSTGSGGSQTGNIGILTDIISASTNSLTLSAAGNIVVDSNINLGGALNIQPTGNFVMGANLSNGVGAAISADGGFTKTGTGTSYLTGSITTNGQPINIAGPVQIGSFDGSGNPVALNSNGGAITLPGAVSAYSGTNLQSYASLIAQNMFGGAITSGTGSANTMSITFGTAGNWSFIPLWGMPSAVDYLVIGGGGGGGASVVGTFQGGGGGAGGVANGSYDITAGQTIALQVGSGGAQQTRGGDSSFGGILSGGGGAGGNAYFGNGTAGIGGAGYTAGGAGGGAGGHANCGGCWAVGGAGGTGTQRNGGSGAQSWNNDGSYGGGATGNAVNWTSAGPGFTSSVTGASVTYGVGGLSGSLTPGSGGDSGYSGSYTGQNGAVILGFTTGSNNATTTNLNINSGAGAVTLGSTVTNLNSLNILAGSASSIAGVISGSGSLTKAGTGALTLSAQNTFTGGTTVNAGTLVLNDVTNNSNGVILGTLTVNSGGTVQLTGSPGTLGWSANRVTTLNINGGMVEAISGQHYLWNLTGGLNFNGGGTLRSNGGVSNAAATSYLTLTTPNITVNNPTAQAEIAGRLNLRNDNGTPVFTVADGAATNDLLISAAVTEVNGTGFTKAGAGKLTLTGTNSYSGTTTINAGTLQVGAAGTSGTLGSGGVTNNASLVFDRSDATTVANAISGTGNVTKLGTNTLTLSGGNSYSGGTMISSGIMKLGNNTALGTSTATVADGAALDLNGFNAANALSVIGTGVSSSGVLYNSAATVGTASGAITLTGDSTFKAASTGGLTIGAVNGAFGLIIDTGNAAFTQSGIVGGTSAPTSYSVTSGTATLNGAVTAAGPISISGSNVNLNANLTSTLSGAGISVLASGNIALSNNLSFITNDGNLLFASDTDATGGGNFSSAGSMTANTTGAGAGVGNITIGGGNTSGTGYALGDGINGSYRYLGVGSAGAFSLSSGGGNISIKGKSSTVNGGGSRAWGVGFDTTTSINSGTGTVTIDGVSQGSASDYATGVFFNFASGTTSITSANTTANAIQIIGSAATALNTTWGQGIRFNTAGASITATGTGGGITLQGTRSTPAGSIADIYVAGGNILANGGAINISGSSTGGKLDLNATALGKKAATTVTSSASNITLTADAVAFGSASTIDTSGTLTVQPYSNNFTSTLTWPLSNLTLSSDVSALTLGKNIGSTAHTDTITVAGATSIAGPINIFAGTINLNANLTSTLSGAGVLAKASGNIVTAASTLLKTNNGNLTLWSDSDNNGLGSISLGNSNTFNTSLNGASTSQATGGGKITLAGGLDTNADGLPDGYAMSATSDGIVIGSTGATSSTSFYSGGGDVLIKGKTTAVSGGIFGVSAVGNLTIDSGQGAINMAGESTASYGLSFSLNKTSGQGLSLTSAKTGATAISLTGISTGANTYGLAFNNDSTKDILATGGGDIAINGTGTGTGYGLYLDGTRVLASSGNITLDGGTKGIHFAGTVANTIGRLAGSAVTSSSSTITLTGDRLTVGAATAVDSTGALTVQPYSTSFTSALNWPMSNLTLGSGISGLTLGKSGNTADITIGGATSIAGPINIHGGNITIDAALTASGANTIWLYGSGNVTEGAGGYLVADKLALMGGNVTLTNASNNIGTLAASGVSNLTYVDSNALTIGTVNPTGITATGAVSISTLTGDLEVTESITTTNATADAVILNAGKAAAAGTAAGGNILVTSGKTITVGAGGTAKLYTGSIAGSTNLSTMSGLGSGSGRFRYNADETTNFAAGSWTNLGTGLNAIYREQPSASGTISSETITYGAAPPTFTLSGGALQNGDDSNAFTIVSAAYSTANKLKASGSPYTVSASGLIGLGYNVSAITNGSLTVNAKNLTISGFVAADKTYDGGNVASISNAGSLNGLEANDVVTLSNTGATFDNKNRGTAKTVTLNGIALADTDAGNYTVSNSVTDTADIAALGITVTAAAKTKTYGEADPALTYSGSVSLVGSDAYTGALTRAAGENVAAYAINQGSLAINDGNGGNNYVVTYAGNDLSITPRPINITANTSQSKIYGNGDPTLTYSAEANSSGRGLVGSDTFSGLLARAAGENVGNLYAINQGTLANSNYAISFTANNFAITPRPITLTASAGQTKVYGNFDPTLTYSVEANGSDRGLVGSDTFSGAPARAAGEDVGNLYAINQGSLANGNYAISFAANNFAITPRPITLTASAASKTYGAADPSLAVAVTGGSLGSLTVSDTLADVTGTLTRQNGENVGNYDIALGAGAKWANYIVSFVADNNALTITPKTVSLSAAKTYDGTTNLYGSHVTITTGVGSETLTYSGATTSDAHVATAGKYINAITLADGGNGGLASNYVLPTLNALNAPTTITAATLTPTLSNTGVTRVYNGTTNAPDGFAPIWSYLGLVSGDSAAALTYTSAAYNDANVANANKVTVSGLVLGAITGNKGSQVTDYVLSATSKDVAATISKATLTVRADNDAKFVTQLDPTNFSGVSYSGFVNGETAAVLGGAPIVERTNPAIHTAGHYTGVLQASGLSADNYQLNYANGDFTVVPSSQLLVRVTDTNNAYGTATAYSVSRASYWNGTSEIVLAGPTANGSNSFTLSDGAGGTATFTLAPQGASTSGAGLVKVGSYQLATVGTVTENSINFSDAITVVGSHQVNTKALTASASGGISKTYDGNTSMNDVRLSLSTKETNDAVTVSGLGAFGSKNAGTNLSYTINNLALGGADAENYHLSGGASFSGNDGVINKKTLTLAAGKIYDGTTNLNGFVTLGGLVGGETLTYSGATANDAHVATAGKYINAISLGNGSNGGLADNYAAPTLDAANAAVTITPKALTTTAPTISGTSKTYDGTLAANGSSLSGGSVSGLIGNDSGTLNTSGITLTYNDTHVATANKTISANGSATLSFTGNATGTGAGTAGNEVAGQASDYSFTAPVIASVAGDITAASLTPTLTNTGVSKVYDGTTSAPAGFVPTWTFSGLVSGDTAATLAYGSAHYNDKNVANANQLTLSGLTVNSITGNKGSQATDYGLSAASNSVAANITAKMLTLTGFSAANKTYDGTTAAAINSVGVLSGVVANDQLTVSNSGANFANKHAGNAKTVTLSGVSLGGASASNYHIASTTTATADIRAKPVTLNPQAATRVYNGVATYTPSPSDQAFLNSQLGVSGDSLSAVTLSFDSKNAGTRTLSVSTAAVNDGNNGNNYTITLGSNTNSSITRLDSVTWVGPASGGNWFDPANWAGGAIPDLSNVANVVIPNGATPVFGTTVVSPAESGAVNLNSIGTQGGLIQNGGTLNIGNGGMTLDTFSQSGGTMSSTGNVTLNTFTQTGGSTSTGGDLTVNTGYSQGTSGSVTVSGNTRITDLNGGAVIGNLTTNGTTTITSTGGDITQASGTSIVANGSTTINASNGAAKADISLNGSNNNFVGPFNGNGNNISVVDGSGDLKLGTITATGNLTANASGDVGQTSGTAITVGGKTAINSSSGNVSVVAGSPNLFTGGLTVSDATTRAAGQARSDAAMVEKVIPPPVFVPPPPLPLPTTSPAPITTISTSTSLTPEIPVVPGIGGESGLGSAATSGASSNFSGTPGVSVELQQTPTQEAIGMVSVLLPKGIATSGTGFTFNLPAEMFTNATGATSIQVTMADGLPLPNWLRFDAESRRFAADAVPDGAFPIQLRLTIGDKQTMIMISERNE